MITVTREDLADLYQRIAENHDPYPPPRADLSEWIDVWSEVVDRAGWSHGLFAKAIAWFYGGDPICWFNGPYVGQPRPILPCDITAFAQLQGIP